jgi:hypothetical protein
VTLIRQVAHHDAIAAGKYRFAGPGSVLEVRDGDAAELLAMTFEMTPCCGGARSGPQPMFEAVKAQADNKTETEHRSKKT